MPAAQPAPRDSRGRPRRSTVGGGIAVDFRGREGVRLIKRNTSSRRCFREGNSLEHGTRHSPRRAILSIYLVGGVRCRAAAASYSLGPRRLHPTRSCGTHLSKASPTAGTEDSSCTRREFDHDLHTRMQQRRSRGAESGGYSLIWMGPSACPRSGARRARKFQQDERRWHSRASAQRQSMQKRGDAFVAYEARMIVVRWLFRVR